MKEGTVVQWFKNEGDSVQKGEPLVEVLSEKVTYDVEAPESGTLRKILAVEGSSVPVDQAVGVIAAADESLEEISITEHEPARIAEATAPASPQTEVAERVPASPAAKKLARELGVDLLQVRGTGPEGRIIEDDVRRFAELTAAMPKIREIVPLRGIRKTTADRLALSARTAPHSTIVMEADMSNAVKLHHEMQVAYTDILVKAVAEALDQHRLLNATLDDYQIKLFEDINVGVAVATKDGLVVPVIRDADKKTLREVAVISKELVGKAKEGKLSRQDLTGGTFTITNLGMHDVDVFFPIINPPETAILGVGRVIEKPVAVDGHVIVRPRMQLSLTYDHRVVDGAPAAEFLKTVKQNLETSGFKDS
jgi:pyruvate dehydrogenase E2 component (dihydrolipoamide acetyltransferase)